MRDDLQAALKGAINLAKRSEGLQACVVFNGTLIVAHHNSNPRDLAALYAAIRENDKKTRRGPSGFCTQ